MSKINSLHTCCRNCLFALYNGKTQTGCYVGRIEKYRQINTQDVLPVYDDDKEFYVINNKLCFFYRDKRKVTPGGIDNFAKKVRKQMEIKYHIIIFFTDDHNIIDLEDIFYSIKKQKIKPQIITIINRNERWANIDLIKRIQSNLNELAPLWKIKRAVNKDLPNEVYVDLAFDATKKNPYSLYIVCQADYLFPPSFIKNLDRSINDELKTFHLAYDDNLLIVPKNIHDINSGNAFKSLKQKIEKHTRVEELCPKK